MKRLKRWFLPMFTLLLIGAGAVMPWAAARFQDHYGISTQEVMPLDAVSLTLQKESEIGTVLRLVGNVYDETEWPGETSMTEEDACAAALDALVELEKAGLIESGWMGDYGYVDPGILERLKAGGVSGAAPILCIAENGSSAIVWGCYWEGAAVPSYSLIVDDATGLAVVGHIACSSTDDPEEAYRRTERWRTFFQDYYGIESPEIKENMYDAGRNFVFCFDPEDGLGECGLSVYLYSYQMGFYPSSPEELALFSEDQEFIVPRAILPAPEK